MDRPLRFFTKQSSFRDYKDFQNGYQAGQINASDNLAGMLESSLQF